MAIAPAQGSGFARRIFCAALIAVAVLSRALTAYADAPVALPTDLEPPEQQDVGSEETRPIDPKAALKLEDQETEECLKSGPDFAAAITSFASGSLKSTVCQRDGVPEGVAKTWYSNGKMKSEGYYRGGQMSGHWIRWHPNGSKMDEGNWEKGRPTGPWQSWYADGSPRASGLVENGTPVCVWKSWNDQGQLSEVAKSASTQCPDLENARIEVPAAPPPSWRDIHSYAHFQLYSQDWIQGSGGYTFSFGGSWDPRVQIFPILSAGLDVAGAVNKAHDANGTMFLAMQVQGMLSYTGWQDYALEAGGGVESWISNGGAHPAVSADLARKIRLAFVDRIFVGYSLFFFPTSDLSHEIRLGLGLAF